jgi:imidazolonepropionase-like amidohydrolase
MKGHCLVDRLRRLLLCLLLGALAATATAGELKALVGGVLIDGTGGAPLRDSVIIVDGARIVSVGQRGNVAIPETAEVIPTDGLTVLPGLWDLAVHLSRLGYPDSRRWDEVYLPIAERVVMPIAARQLLLSGVTSARDVASPLAAALSVRERINSQRLPGPTLYVGGPALGKKGGQQTSYRWEIADAADAEQKARRLTGAGVDYLLVTGPSALRPAELEAITRVAREKGIPWHAEIRRDDDVAVALAANAAGLVGVGLDVNTSLPAAAISALGARAAAEDPVPWVLGASELTNYSWLRHNSDALDRPDWREGLPPIIAEDLRLSLDDLGKSGEALERPAERRAVLGARLQSARASGARLLVGSDSGMPAHFHNRATWQEIAALVTEAGVPPLAAIRAATLDSAQLMGAANDSGSIEAGKYADIIAVKGDVLDTIDALKDVQLVMRHGLRQR